MTDDQGIRGVLFDSGGVLIGPVGGRWNPRYDFESIVVEHYPETRVELFPKAFAVGQRTLDATTTTVNRTVYHRAMLQVLGIDEPSEALLHELEAPAAGPTIEPFPDVRPVLDQLQAWGVGMSVVSDNWAGLELGYRALGIEHYFAGFVISEVLGCCKPDPRMYAAGSDLLGLDPGECLFIDDDPELVSAAIQLGYQGVALIRVGQHPATVPAITTLDELLPLVAGARRSGPVAGAREDCPPSDLTSSRSHERTNADSRAADSTPA
ncbi:HAD-IA family hydrolase [Actinopolymorpha pittospori]|uniref:HAD superfamily hydrolase (TIGR01509 family) n=1 Tax=Actinopolymorpha pittospori TaxID=648752 RepID=A0A927MR13_9ACTN|nr:HAD superfamily hydrolase (TIGR01509 family) [Actinopolymorpha pittospori]